MDEKCIRDLRGSIRRCPLARYDARESVRVNGVQQNGVRVQAWTCNSDSANPNQQWKNVGDGSPEWAGTDKCLDLTNGNTQQGTPVDSNLGLLAGERESTVVHLIMFRLAQCLASIIPQSDFKAQRPSGGLCGHGGIGINNVSYVPFHTSDIPCATIHCCIPIIASALPQPLVLTAFITGARETVTILLRRVRAALESRATALRTVHNPWTGGEASSAMVRNIVASGKRNPNEGSAITAVTVTRTWLFATTTSHPRNGIMPCSDRVSPIHRSIERESKRGDPGYVLSSQLNATAREKSRPSINTSLSERIRLPGAASEVAVSQLGADGQFPGIYTVLIRHEMTLASVGDYLGAGVLYELLANYDIASNGTTFKSALSEYFPLAEQLQNRQNFSDPSSTSSWRRPSINTSLSERIRLAGAAAEVAVSQLGADGQFLGIYTVLIRSLVHEMTSASVGDYYGAGVFYGLLANYDIASNGTSFKSALSEYFPLAEQLQNRQNFSDPSVYGHAAARAYTAYGDPAMLGYATDVWWYARAYTLSEDGNIPTKNVTISSSCPGASIPDPIYLHAARDSAVFVQNHLLNTQLLVQGSIAADDCVVSPSVVVWDTGLMIEALTALGSYTKNTTVLSLLNGMIQAAIFQSDWVCDNGVIANPLSGDIGDMELPRSLALSLTYHVIQDPALRQGVEAFLAVQYNAVVDLATNSNTNIYGGVWDGPPGTEFSSNYQAGALSALVAAILLPVNDSANALPAGSTTSTPSSTTSTPLGRTSSMPIPSSTLRLSKSTSPATGLLVGIILGGIVFLCISVALPVYILRRRRRRSTVRDPTRSGNIGRRPTPYTLWSSQPSLPLTPPMLASIPTARSFFILAHRKRGVTFELAKRTCPAQTNLYPTCLGKLICKLAS
ncbi:hypothetical protein C8F01DRAFT_1084068 [Mycena amicta]|nr:hypothetical protein C8F01DRAFT_1084068 [Mycena amicta]